MGRCLLVVQARQAPRGVDLAALSNAGYALKLVPATAAHASNLEPEIDAIVLDGLDDAGWAYLREAVDADLRRLRVVCSAGQPSSAIIGMLDIGVACHLTFDVSERELLARIEWACARAQTPEPTTVPVLEIDDDRRRVWLNGKKPGPSAP